MAAADIARVILLKLHGFSSKSVCISNFGYSKIVLKAGGFLLNSAY